MKHFIEARLGDFLLREDLPDGRRPRDSRMIRNTADWNLPADGLNDIILAHIEVVGRDRSGVVCTKECRVWSTRNKRGITSLKPELGGNHCLIGVTVTRFQHRFRFQEFCKFLVPFHNVIKLLSANDMDC